jgi:hypothetical protein
MKSIMDRELRVLGSHSDYRTGEKLFSISVPKFPSAVFLLSSTRLVIFTSDSKKEL